MREGLQPLVEGDLENLHALICACETEDRSGSVPSLESLRHQFMTPGLDLERHLFVLPESDGRLAAFAGAVPLPGQDGYTFHLILAVRPDHRSSTLEEDLLRFVEERAVEWRQETGNAAVLHAGAQAHQARYVRLYESNGYRAVRWFLELERDLTQPIPEMPAPEGFTLKPMDPQTDVETLHFTVMDSFQDHWSPPGFSLEQTAHAVSGPGFRPDLTLLAYDSNGEAAGVCMSHVREEYNRQNGTQEGLIDTVGVRRPFRRMGLARTLLTQDLRLLKAAGLTMAALYVDADSPTGATRLYEAVGFTERKRSIVFEKPVGLPVGAQAS